MPTLKKCSKRKYVQHSDPGKIMDLVMSLTDDTCALLQTKINTYLKEECEADIVFHIIVQVDRREASIEAIDTHVLPKKMKITLTPKFDAVLKSVCEISDLLTNFETDFQEIVTPYVAKDVPKKRIVMYPLLDKPFAVIYCVVTPQIQEEQVAIFIRECSLFIWPTLKKTIALESECMQKQKCQLLLRSNRKIIAQVACIRTLLRVAAEQMKLLAKAQECALILIDVDKMDLYDASDTYHDQRFPLDRGITGEVIKTGRVINLQNAKDHPAYDPNIDCISGETCRSLLCFPIRERAGIIGAGLLTNKIDDPYFDSMDEEMALAFSIYCGICIVHSTMFGKIQEAHIRCAIANEMVMYHLKVEDREVAFVLDCKGFHDHPQVINLDFNPRALPLRELPCYVLKMFTDLGLDKKFDIKRCKLTRFILQVRKGYRDVPYHSWLHCFNVVQWTYAAIINFKLQKFFTDLQLLMLMLAALMHDLDHRGTTTSFQLHGKTTLASLFSSEGSVMERHHLTQALCLLNTEGCDILSSLPRRDYDRALILLRDLIVATDVTNYIDKQDDYKAMGEGFIKNSRDHLNSLLCLLMTCADFSDQLKEWSSVKKTAASALTEILRQSEAEKSRGEVSAIQLDKAHFCIPDLEIQFLREICIPLFQTLGMILPEVVDHIKTMEQHVEKWDNCRSVFEQIPPLEGIAVILSPELDTLIELNIREKEMERERLEKERLEAEEAEAAAAAKK